MKRMIKTVLATVMTLSLAACGGGGGSTSTGGVYFTHEELAKEFVRRVNVDVYGYDLTLVKTNTLSYDYIVVYDHDNQTYDAYWLGNYNPGENLGSYLRNYDHKFYYDLIPHSGNQFEDYRTGTLFEATKATGKNLDKMKALSEHVAISKAAESLRAEYGMSEEKAQDTARFAYKVKTSAPGTYNTKDYDAFAKQLTGSTVTEFQGDIKSGNLISLNSRLKAAGEVSGMGSEGVNKLIEDIFTK